MRSDTDWHRSIVEQSRLPADAEAELRDRGFTVLPGPAIARGPDGYSDAFDQAVMAADASDIFRCTSTRIDDFVNRREEFDGVYIHAPVLAACAMIIGIPFKLSGMRGRTLEPGAPMERLHVDVKPTARDWPIVGAILMVDAFTAENGATRFVPGTHLQSSDPDECLEDSLATHKDQVLACGPAGSIIIFHASAWHGHTANRSQARRRSVQAHFVARNAQESTHHGPRMREETMQRISGLARYVLAV